jgi:hypothetical protein
MPNGPSRTGTNFQRPSLRNDRLASSRLDIDEQ